MSFLLIKYSDEIKFEGDPPRTQKESHKTKSFSTAMSDPNRRGGCSHDTEKARALVFAREVALAYENSTPLPRMYTIGGRKCTNMKTLLANELRVLLIQASAAEINNLVHETVC